MAKILIPTIVYDTESETVASALEQRGHSVTRWFMGDYPSQQTHTVATGADGWHASIKDCGLGEVNLAFDTMWLRRPSLPHLGNMGSLDDIDKEIAETELFAWRTALLHSLSTTGKWVNPYPSARLANSKPYQLLMAREVGFQIPDTVMSNDPDRIKSFLEANGGRIIYKSFTPLNWKIPDGKALVYTSRVTHSDLPEDSALQAVPGIYQAEVKKQFEVRVAMVGDDCFAIRIDAPTFGPAPIDWRSDGFTTFHGEAFSLPDEIESKCRRMMRLMGLVCGSFDFAVNEVGQFVFFEINEAGQMLWLERFAPEFTILESLIRVLTGDSPTTHSFASRADEIVHTDTYRANLRNALILRVAPHIHAIQREQFGAVLIMEGAS